MLFPWLDGISDLTIAIHAKLLIYVLHVFQEEFPTYQQAGMGFWFFCRRNKIRRQISSDNDRLILYHAISLSNKELTENGRWVIIRDITVETEFPEQKQNQSDIRE